MLYFRLSNIIARRYNVLKWISLRRISNKSNREPYKVCILPALEDNYMYVLIDNATKTAAAIDPVESEKVLDCAGAEGVKITSVLTTHHHFDHSGGNKLITEKVKNLAVYGGDDRIDCMTSKLSHGDLFKVGDTLIECLETPCHTSGHVCYYVKGKNSNPICFTGDTLFVGGCGRFFEGSAEQMLRSLSILSALPGSTEIYCGHEYTLNNLRFAACVEPDNEAVREKLAWVESKRKKSEPTVPSTIKDELNYNPFLRVKEPSVHLYTKKTNPVDVMSALRKAKDNF